MLSESSGASASGSSPNAKKNNVRSKFDGSISSIRSLHLFRNLYERWLKLRTRDSFFIF